MTPFTATGADFESLSLLSPPPKQIKENKFYTPSCVNKKVSMLNMEEQISLINYFCEKIREICNEIDNINQTNVIRKETITTALHYFQRFYLTFSIMEYDPKYAILGCISLANKFTEDNISLQRLFICINKIIPDQLTASNKFPREYNSSLLNMIYLTQLHISEGIDYNYYIYTPYTALRVFFFIFIYRF